MVKATLKLKGNLLILPTTSDINAPLAHSWQLVNALVQADKPHDLAIFPEGNHHHKYLDQPVQHSFWRKRIKRYFIEHLQH